MSSPNRVTVSQISDVTTVELTTQGPQGPQFATSGALSLMFYSCSLPALQKSPNAHQGA